MEIFKDIPSYKGLYQVSNIGSVKSLERKVTHWKGGVSVYKEKILKPSNENGYYRYKLSKGGKQKITKGHQLVAMAFLGHKPDGMNLVVNHINFNKLDNRVENLEIITQRENSNQKNRKSTSKYVGVSLRVVKSERKWLANIWINGKQTYIGIFKTELEAHLEYKKKLLSLSNETKRKSNESIE